MGVGVSHPYLLMTETDSLLSRTPNMGEGPETYYISIEFMSEALIMR
jgi:hypothetical protein